MKLKLRPILIGSLFIIFFVGVPIAVLNYFLPHHALLRIVGAETRHPLTSSKNNPATHDVFYIFAEDVDTKTPRVFINDDTGWGFPWYFKFNSADLQAIANSLAGERGTAILTYYGWRIQIFSTTPNIVNIKRAPEDAQLPFPWFNIAAYLAVILGVAWLTFRIRRFWRRR